MIEQLVVIAIIAILASMLLPALNQARVKAKSIIVFADGHVKQHNVSKLTAWLTRGYTISSIPNHYRDHANAVLESE